MLSPGRVDLTGDRFTPFIREISFAPIDLTAAVMKAQVRDRKDGGTIRADLATVTIAGTEGLRLDSVSAIGGITTSIVTMRINESTMEAIPYGTERGDDLLLYWDLHITPSGGAKEVYLFGNFTVLAGVTE
jgi:hypothetical protein